MEDDGQIIVRPVKWYAFQVWMFSVRYKGKTYGFYGVPNKCMTKRSAISRAAWRLKWLREGTYDQHYK